MELVENGAVIATVQAINSNAVGNQWQQHVVDLSAYSDRNVELRITVTNDGGAPTSFFLDDISLYGFSVKDD